MSPRRALVLGASGLVGSRCVAHLVERASYERITCLVRRSCIEPTEKLRERVVDFGELTEADIDPSEDLYCAIGSTMKKAGSREAFRAIDFELPLRVAELAVAKGTRRLALVSSVGANASSSNFYLATKGALEDALARLTLEALHVFRPGLLLGERAEARPGEAVASVVARATQGLLVGPLRRYRPVDGDSVARAMIAAIEGKRPQPALQIHEHDAVLALAASL